MAYSVLIACGRAMDRSLVFAACLSLVFHVVIFLILISISFELNLSDSPSDIAVKLELSDESTRAGESDSGDTESKESADLAELIPETGQADSEPIIFESEQIVALGEPGSVKAASAVEIQFDTEPVPATLVRKTIPFESTTRMELADPESTEIVSSVEKTDAYVPLDRLDKISPEASTESIPVSQQAMLDERFNEWARNFHKMELTDSPVTWEHQDKVYTATFRQLPVIADTDIEQVMVKISTIDEGRKLSTEMRIKRLAFSHYAQFINRWDPYVQINKDEIEGRFHSNTEIQLGYDRAVTPVFHGKVTTGAHRINTSKAKGRLRRNEVFLGGLETGVRKIKLPRHYEPFHGEQAIEEEQVHLFEEDTRITFLPDGSFRWQPVESTESEHHVIPEGESTYLLAANKTELYVSGTISGKVLVYSPKKIVIEDDLVYASNPGSIDEFEDYLGLVSDRSIEVAGPDVTGTGDLNIHASIYAKVLFRIRDARIRDDATLYIFGSLTVGSMTETEPRFATNVQFDQRLENARPPGFPMTDHYEPADWNAVWKIEPLVADAPPAELR